MNQNEYQTAIKQSQLIQRQWQLMPAPKRGDLIRVFGNVLRTHKESLGSIITAESRKILAEGLGEAQEMIDMCDFGAGLSRQLYGLTMSSERPHHRLQEIWQPLGVVGVISAFNFPAAVWAWNHVLAIICGNSVVWKPSPKTMKVAQLCKTLWDNAVEQAGMDGKDLLLIVEGDKEQSNWMAEDSNIKLLSATGSTQMGKSLAPLVAARLGRGLYELGGNNGMIVSQHANLELVIRAIVFSAVGTCGQRCTTLRRLIVHESVYQDVLEKLTHAYSTLSIGDPMDINNLVGPLINNESLQRMQDVLTACRNKSYPIHGGDPLPGYSEDAYVKPAIVEVSQQCDIVKQETFAPILYMMKYQDLDQAIELHNDVPQGLSSCIFTDSVSEAETFISAQGSDCGIVNVNIGPSGAEIGGAFGGEKDTGGGRESGSDSWKAYMRRTTVTVNYGKELPLSQGIQFDI